jgi:hypothetical protein
MTTMKIPFFFREHIERQIQDFLMAYADSLIAGSPDMDQLLEQYADIVREQVEGLLTLTERISHSLTPVTPSEQFVSQLRHDLIEVSASPAHRSLWGRIRSLPPRTQIAAGIGGATLTAGVVIIASRSMPSALEYWRNRRIDVA